MPDQSSAATEHAILQEITAPLEGLPDDPLATVDADFPTTLRGYDRLAVDDYVRRTRQLVAELQATRTPESAVRRALERVGEQISGILQRAHETAEQITAQSRREAEDRLELARAEAAQIAGAAEARVRELDADTDRIWLERQRIVADAEDLAGQLVALAKEASSRFPEDSGAQSEPVEDPGAATMPYLEDEDLTEPVAAPIDGDEEFDRVEDEPPPRYEKSEIERTMSFKPLERQAGEAPAEGPAAAPGAEAPGPEAPGAGAPGPEAPGAEAPGAEATGADVPGPREPRDQTGGDDATAIIPPASQAANRRQTS